MSVIGQFVPIEKKGKQSKKKHKLLKNSVQTNYVEGL